MGLLSESVIVRAQTWSHKRPSEFNYQVAEIVNSTPNSLVVSSALNARPGKIASLCTLLQPDQAILAFDEVQPIQLPDGFDHTFAFALSKGYKETLKSQGYGLVPVAPEADFWRIEKPLR